MTRSAGQASESTVSNGRDQMLQTTFATASGLREEVRDRTAHVLFIHGWLGSELVSRTDPSQIVWGDNSISQVRALVMHREVLTTLEEPRPLVPRNMRTSYRDFFEGLKLLGGFYNPTRNNLTAFVYDWRLGMAEAGRGLDAALSGLPSQTSVIAHSYGGLVIMHALAAGMISHDNASKLKKIILIAPPYFGATFALLGLAKSGDFMRRAAEFLPSFMKTVFAFAANSPDFITNYLAPVFGSFQSLYDMIPHDIERADLQVLAIKGLEGRFTSQRWPYWTATQDATARLAKAREAQRLLQRDTWPVDVIAIYSDTEMTPHRCTATERAPFVLTHLANELGDGIVAACCATPPGAALHRVDWANKAQNAATGHNQLQHHPRTRQLLEELLR